MQDTAGSQLADALEAAASRDLYAAAPPALGATAHCVAKGAVLVAAKVPTVYFNRAIGLRDEAELATAVALYSEAGVKDYWIHATADAPALRAALERLRFSVPARRSWAKFLRAPDPAKTGPTRYAIRPATHADRAQVGQVVCSAYGLPPAMASWFAALVGRPNWQVFVAEHEGQVIATGSAFTCAEGTWLGIGATQKEFREAGAQGGLLAARINAAAAAGSRWLSTETGEPMGDEPNPSFNNIRRAGFRQVCSRLNYASPRA